MDSLKIHTIEIDTDADEKYDTLNFFIEFPAPLKNGIAIWDNIKKLVGKDRSIIYAKKYFPTVRLVYKSQEIDSLKESTRNLNVYSIGIQGIIKDELVNFVVVGASPSKEKVQDLIVAQGWKLSEIGGYPSIIMNRGTVYDWNGNLDFDLYHGCVEPWWLEDKYKDTHRAA
jgi:hypothetical protein